LSEADNIIVFIDLHFHMGPPWHQYTGCIETRTGDRSPCNKSATDFCCTWASRISSVLGRWFVSRNCHKQQTMMFKNNMDWRHSIGYRVSS